MAAPVPAAAAHSPCSIASSSKLRKVICVKLFQTSSSSSFSFPSSSPPLSSLHSAIISVNSKRHSPEKSLRQRNGSGFVVACLPSSSPKSDAPASTKLFVSGLSFRTTEESLRNAFQNFGQLVEVNLVMDRVANRPRGFAFIRYATEEESKRAIDGMHGKFLDGRVIFVEVAKPKSELREGTKQTPRRY